MSRFELKRLGVVMEPELGNPQEIEGVLNPAAVRGPDGALYLFPRLVARGNYSRIGIARVRFNGAGDPAGVERLGIALEPEADYERRSDGSGGCEDPRVTFVEPLQRYVMTYTAFSPMGPRIALAISEDLQTWERLGLATFDPYEGIHFDGVDNKDAAMFPLAVPNMSAQPELAILHRPLFPGTLPEDTMLMEEDRDIDLHRESIWISYTPAVPSDVPYPLAHFTSHHRLAAPVSDWESLKIGSGAPPALTKHGWLFIYHGVSDVAEPESDTHQITYSAGVVVLSKDHPPHVLYPSTHPGLSPQPSMGPRGTPSNVVFPTAIDRRDDIGEPDRLDV